MNTLAVTLGERNARVAKVSSAPFSAHDLSQQTEILAEDRKEYKNSCFGLYVS